MTASNANTARSQTAIAVVGAGALFPGSGDKLGFWRDILAGKDLVTEVPPTHWLVEDYYDPDPSAPDKVYARRGAFLQAADFNPLEFAIPPANLPSTDTAQLLALLVAKQVLEDATAGQFAHMDRSRASVVLGVASATELVTQLSARMQRPVWAHALRQHGLDEAQVQALCDRISSQYVPWTENSFPGMLGNVVAGRIANRFDLAGTNCVIDAACASSLAAVHLALLELESGHSDLVITGGVDALNDILMYTCFSKTPALSATGDCRPFSASADGTLLGEGIGMLALKRLADAERDGDRIYAVIRGLGTSSDGQSKSIYAPVAAGQAKALRRSYEAAGYEPRTVELLEAHGTATRAGDLAEFQGLASVFEDPAGADTRWCALGSVKSQIGHTKAAAGSAGLFKAVMALHHKVLPPTIKIDQPNPALKLGESPFYLNTRARPWVRGSDHPRRASVSSFGFGGSNYHVTLEEYTGPSARRPRLRTHASELLLVGAESAEELLQRCRALDLSPGSVSFSAHESLQAWRGGTHRLALVVDADSAATTMAQALDRIERQPSQAFALPGGVVHYGVGAATGPVAFLFSGQGSQYLEMGRDLAMAFDAARAVWDRAADLDLGPAPLHRIVFPPPAFSEGERQEQERELTATQRAQPGIGALQLSQLALLRQIGIEPVALAGHSFGEFTALAAAGCLSADDLLRVARRRGELMAGASDAPGAMTAVMGGPKDLEQQVEACGFGIVAANRNAPAQLVFSGPLQGIEQLEAWLVQRKLEFRRLPVSTAFHSPLVASAAPQLQAFLDAVDVRPPALPVYANTTAQPYETQPGSIRRQLAWQLATPVRFREQIENMYAAGVRTFVEVGPRGALAGFVEQTLGGRTHHVVSLDRQGTDGVLSFLLALARLGAAGVAMRPAELWAEYEAPADPRLRKKAPLSVPILGSNYGRPYPPAAGASRSAPAAVDRAAAAQAAELELQSWMAQLQARPAARPPEPAITAPAVLADAPEPGPRFDALREALLAVVAEKTGYPADMLDLSLELEAGLGIDSIKRVEILSAFRDRMPGLPEVAPSQLAALNTLGEVLAFMQGGQPTSEPAPLALAESPIPVATLATAGSAPASEALRQTLLEVVAEKTGYPADMLDLSLELESGLGIDSIKRVEILSAFRDRMPGLPEVAPSQLAALNTLGEVLAFMQAGTPATETPTARGETVPTTTSAEAPAPSIDTSALRDTLLAVVAEKTGYPADMLDLSLELESGLGIDSIKRVEILSAFRDRMPGLPEVAPSQLAALNTLGEVLAFMQAGTPATETPTAREDSVPATTSAAAPAPSIDTDALRDTLLAVVAEKTGYPADMLDLSLELESGLGIDSIKRVEILSAFRDRMPGLPEVAPSQLAALNTLGEVLAFMQAGTPATETPTAREPSVPTTTTTTAPAPAIDSDALRGTLLAVVAEKTGYPADMLDLSLELESGLGIDSIKRVEILSAFRDRMPGLPEVAPSQLAALNTLGEVLAFMQAGTPATETPTAREDSVPTTTTATAAAPSTDTNALRDTLLAVVAEKTGYPADMLDLSLELESGLGIDSIKRVEILSAFRDRMPGLPEVAPSQLAALNTLGEVLAFMQSGAPQATAAPPVAAAAQPVPTPPVIDFPSTSPLPRHAVRAVPQSAAGFTLPGLLQRGACIAVADDGQGVAALVARALQARGVSARVITEPSAAPDFTGLVVLSGLGRVADAADAVRVNRRAFEFVHAMSPRLSERDGLLVTVQDTGGDFGLSGRAGVRAWLGGIAALARTAANEWPQAAVKAIDLEVGGRAPAALAKALVHELFEGGAEREVGLPARAERLTLSTEVCTAPAGPLVVDANSVVLATGGARGVTAVCLTALARMKPRLAILGRTPLTEEPPAVRGAPTEADLKRVLLEQELAQGRKPTPAQLSRLAQGVLAAREVRANLQAMRDAGAQVLYCVADVSDARSVERALAQVRQHFGPITGLIHGAGVLADRLIKDKTLAQYDSVFSTKVEGLLHLLHALERDPLQAMVLFSSVAARVGNPGQCDYAMANEVLNQVALVEARRRGQCLVRSIGWGPWDGGMVTPALRAHFDAQRVSLIDTRSGAAAFMAELHAGGPEIQLVVGPGEPRELLARDTGHRGALTMDVVLDPQRHAYLDSHRIEGKPVVPMVLVAEWFMRAAMALLPGAGMPALRDLRVQRGVVLADWGGQDTRLRVTARFEPGAGRRLRCELHSANGEVLHYAATADFAPPPADAAGASTPAGLRPMDRDGATLYGTPALFHGPDLQAIRRLSAPGGDSIQAELYSGWALGWETATTLDIAALDGALQLAVQSMFESQGAAMLPTHLGEMRVLHGRPPREGIRCTVRHRSADALRTICDIALEGDGWSVQMQGVQLHARVAVSAEPVQG